MSACLKLHNPASVPGARTPLIDLYRGYLAETGNEVAAAILAVGSTQNAATPDPPCGELLTVKQAAQKYQLGERTIYRMIEDGLPVARVGRTGRAVRIKPRDLEKRLEDSETLLR